MFLLDLRRERCGVPGACGGVDVGTSVYGMPSPEDGIDGLLRQERAGNRVRPHDAGPNGATALARASVLHPTCDPATTCVSPAACNRWADEVVPDP